MEDEALDPGDFLFSGNPVIHAVPEYATESSAGLRMVVLPEDKLRRGEVMDALMDARVLVAGDVILTFRPEWVRTMPYPHIQMGISHAGLVRDDGKCRNLDIPLDADYNRNFDSQMDSVSYLKFAHYHIMRPRRFDAQAAESFNQWASYFVKIGPELQRRAAIPFNADYLTPSYAELKITPGDSVRRFRELLMNPAEGRPMKMYCSEFVWHFHSLAASGSPGHPTGNVRTIVDPAVMVDPGPEVGLGEGPLEVIRSIRADLNESEIRKIIHEIFTEKDAALLSPGHQTAAQQVRPLMSVLRGFYEWSFADPSGIEPQVPQSADGMVALLNRDLAPNYSPTLFFTNSFLSKDDPQRRFDYVCTLAFVNPAIHREARALAMAQGAKKTQPAGR